MRGSKLIASSQHAVVHLPLPSVPPRPCSSGTQLRTSRRPRPSVHAASLSSITDLPIASTPLPPTSSRTAHAAGEDADSYVAPPVELWGQDPLLMAG